jgi:hypothetical protein
MVYRGHGVSTRAVPTYRPGTVGHSTQPFVHRLVGSTSVCEEAGIAVGDLFGP